jgi:hypothetical protein
MFNVKIHIMKKYINQEETLNTVEEPIAMYISNSFLKSNVLDNLAQNSKELFTKVIAVSGLTIKTLAENIFEITPKTFIKYKPA